MPLNQVAAPRGTQGVRGSEFNTQREEDNDEEQKEEAPVTTTFERQAVKPITKQLADDEDDWNEVASDGKAKETFVETRVTDANDPYKMAPKRPGGVSTHPLKASEP